MNETAGAEFVARLGEWPSPACSLYRSAKGDMYYRYDYDTDAWTIIAMFPSVVPGKAGTVHLPVPSHPLTPKDTKTR
jgi:hypothetical protein